MHSLENANVLVIGGAGFVGSWIVDQLLEEPVTRVTVLDNFVRGRRENLDWAPGFAGRDMPQWSRRLIALGRNPARLTKYVVVVEGDDVYVEL